MAAIEHAYQYIAPSSVSLKGSPRLVLATSSPGIERHPYFFEGQLRYPRLCAELLTAVHRVVGSRFFIPANTLAHILMLADPVVTSGGGMLRFEGFSSCCSAYIRADLLPSAYSGDIVGKGTTNVDFNAPMCAALARVRDADRLALSIGQKELALQTGSDRVVEKKVSLPVRWLRGMLEVQSYQASMRKMIEVSGLEALRFFRLLPKTSTSKTPLWVTVGPFGLRTSTRPDSQGVRFVETNRLRLLEPLLPKVQSLSIYADERQQASAWVLNFTGARLTLVISAEVWRGFSGEGQALHALMQADEVDALSRIRAHLQWQPSLRTGEVVRDLALSEQSVADTLRVLGVSGLVGFDVFENAYFHRVLPFDLSLAEDMHPRLAGARQLIKEGAVRLLRHAPVEASVRSGDVEHHVREVDGELRCTCPWFAKHQGMRGPCKHVLAVEACKADEGGQAK
ncbi:MAG: SWIM zinc finger family protein [Deltaproteobacteria bacterium]|nr:SWIM zinc finger family protein [Deltaproteobacteria bacterium]